MKWGRGLTAGGRDSGMLATGAGRGVSGLESLSFHTLGRVMVALVPAGPGPLTHPCPRPAPVLVSVASLSPGAPSPPGRAAWRPPALLPLQPARRLHLLQSPRAAGGRRVRGALCSAGSRTRGRRNLVCWGNFTHVSICYCVFPGKIGGKLAVGKAHGFL